MFLKRVFIVLSLFALSFFALAQDEELPYCTIESVDGLLPPTPSFPIGRTTSLVGGRIPLLPVPINRPINPAFFPSIPQTSLLEIIGRADPIFGEWLYVEVRLPEQTFLYGFVLLSQTTFTGDITTLPIIPVLECQSPGDENTPPRSNPPAQLRLVSRPIDSFIVSLPSNWVFYDETVEGDVHPDLENILANPPQVSGMDTEIIFLAAPADEEDVRYFSIFYVATFRDDFTEIVGDGEDPAVLAQDLERGIADLQTWAEEDREVELIESRVVNINSYPYVFAHYIRANVLPDSLLEANDIPDFLNVSDIYVLVTYQDGEWYMIMLIGLRTGAQLHQTILSSIFAE